MTHENYLIWVMIFSEITILDMFFSQEGGGPTGPGLKKFTNPGIFSTFWIPLAFGSILYSKK